MSNQHRPDQHQDKKRVLSMFPDTAAKTLRRMIAVVALAFVVSWTYTILFNHTDSSDLVPSICLATPILLISYREFRANRIQRGLHFLCWALWAFACAFGFIAAGIRTPVLIVVPSLIMTVGWIQGRRSLLIMLMLSVLLFCSYVIFDHYHWLSEPHYRTPVQVLIVDVSVLALSAAIALILAENFKRLIETGWSLTEELRQRVSALKSSEQSQKELNEQLEHRVAQRTVQYDEANQTLQKLVSKLELAQTQLVNADKLASLGSMVAGISHELNTPIGNVLTLTTSMENQYLNMIEKIETGHVKRSELVDFLKTGHEMSVLATRSTKRAVELVSSFKQVAADQTSEQRRSFDLRVVVEDNIATLWPSIKKRNVLLQIDNQVPSNILCDSFPGPLGQVIVNLTQNAILHGLVDSDNGVITITADEQQHLVKISVTDNGVGMPAPVLAHIFDPFFTTRLGKGGSGLGLSISYRIVTSVLGGEISVTSAPGQGARFTLTFPKAAPFKM